MPSLFVGRLPAHGASSIKRPFVVGAWAEWGSTDADLGIRRQRRLARSLVTADLSHRLAVERKALGQRLCADLSRLDSLIDVMLH